MHFNKSTWDLWHYLILENMLMHTHTFGVSIWINYVHKRYFCLRTGFIQQDIFMKCDISNGVNNDCLRLKGVN